MSGVRCLKISINVMSFPSTSQRGFCPCKYVWLLYISGIKTQSQFTGQFNQPKSTGSLEIKYVVQICFQNLEMGDEQVFCVTLAYTGLSFGISSLLGIPVFHHCWSRTARTSLFYTGELEKFCQGLKKYISTLALSLLQDLNRNICVDT